MPTDAPPPARDPETPLERAIEAEICSGLPNEQKRLERDLRVLEYFNLEGHRHLPYEHECHRKTHPLTRRTIEILTSLTYSHPPTREILDDEESNALLTEVLKDNDADGLLDQADEMAMLLGLSAVYAAPTSDGLKPIKLYTYDGSQLATYADPDDVTRIAHVVVISRHDEQTRYDWWSKDFRRVYVTAKAQTGYRTSGGRTARFREDLSHSNVVGRLPFAFFHARRPTGEERCDGLGDWLANYNCSIDHTLYEQALAVRHFYLPRAWVQNAPADWQPTTSRDGEYMRLPESMVSTSSPSVTASVGFLQANLDIEQGVLNTESLIETALAGIGVPKSLYSLDSASFASGDAITAERQPLIDRTLKRRQLLNASETELAECILAVAGAWYGIAEYKKAGLGGVNLAVRWPSLQSESELAAQDSKDLEQGVSSLVDVVQRRYGLSPEEALAHLVRVKEDSAKLAALGISTTTAV